MNKILVLDREWAQTGYLVVDLARAGFDVTLASGHVHEPWGLGRYCRLITAPRGIDDPVFIEKLLREEKADIVFPVAETIQQIVWSLPPELTTKVFPPTTAQQRHLLSDRRAMYSFIEGCGVPVPRLIQLGNGADLEQAIDELGLPLVLRGTQGLAGDQVRVVQDLGAARESYAYLREQSPAPPFAQQFVQGQRYLIGGLFDRGKTLRWFSQTTLEASSTTGPSLRVRSVRDERLTEYAKTLFAAFGWSGLACAEFMRGADGDYRFLEINPRPWAAIQAATQCGVPLMKMFAEYLMGREPIPQKEFKANVDVTLFPAFINDRLGSGKGIRRSDLGYHIQSLKAAPWGRPGLMLHYLRRLRWAAQRGKAARASV